MLLAVISKRLYWTNVNQQLCGECTFLGIARRSALLGAARSRLAVNDRRRHCPETTLQRRFIGIGTPHLDYDGGRQTSAKSKRADLTKGDALTHSTRSPRRAIHFRPLAVGSIMIRNGTADFIGVVGLACASMFRWFEVVRLRTLWTSALSLFGIVAVVIHSDITKFSSPFNA